ncbi:hypothetical protein BLNAU_17962 [Blattamonas nauphoetae]|nr:hypothetical protein BLNAU_17962 [Blattamonas nauphoetae]
MKYVYSNEWGLFPSLGATLRLQKRTTQSTTSRDGLESTAISKENADRQKQATPSLMCLKFNLRQRSSQCSARRKWRRKHARSTGSGEDMSKLSTLLTCQLGHRPSTAMCCTFHLDFSPKDPTDFDDRLSGFGCSVNAERVEHVEMNGLKSVNNTAEMNFQPSPRKQPQPLIQRRERCHRHLYNSDAGMWEGYDQTSLSRLMVSPQTSLRDWRKDDEGPLSSKQENKAPKQIDSDYLQTRDMFLPRFG